MNSLPTELNLKIIHHVRDSILTSTLVLDSWASMTQRAEYKAFLLLMASYHRHWTALAQSELFHHIILKDGDKTRLLLKLLRQRGNGVFRTYAERASSMRLGHASSSNQDYDGLKDHLDELAGYCPDVVEISCASVNTKFSDFQNIRRLDRLNFYGGRHDGSGSFSLPFTKLSITYCILPTPLDLASFPFLRYLSFANLSNNSFQSVLPLLPYITSLDNLESQSRPQISRMLSVSTSLTSLSLFDSAFGYLDDGSYNIIKERLEIIRLRLGRYEVEFSKLAECIAGSKVLKKVILDGLTPIGATARANRITELKRVVEACKKKKTVELWKENFTVNGKVDLNGDVATSFDLA